MNTRLPIGHETRTPVAGAPGFEIRRRVLGHAYARSGNAHNPTPRFSYTLWLDDVLVDSDAHHGALLKAAEAPDARAAYLDGRQAAPTTTSSEDGDNG